LPITFTVVLPPALKVGVAEELNTGLNVTPPELEPLPTLTFTAWLAVPVTVKSPGVPSGRPEHCPDNTPVEAIVHVPFALVIVPKATAWFSKKVMVLKMVTDALPVVDSAEAAPENMAAEAIAIAQAYDLILMGVTSSQLS
jgi:hypothetical protein